MKKIFILLTLLAHSICYAENWMENINSETKLCRMSIPGTHDAGTGSGFEGLLGFLGPITAQTQELDIASQWDAGVRAFDLRPALNYGQLKIFHGVIETQLTFDEALATICKKLEENPTECAIVLMQNEGSASTSDEEWGSYVTESMEKVQDYLIDYTPEMTLGEARGKLLIMNRSLYRPIPHGCVLQGWGVNQSDKEGTIESANGAEGIFHVQDFYMVTEYGASEQKTQYIENMLHKSNSSTNNHIYFNFTSGYTLPVISGICENASNANTYLADLLQGDEQEYSSTGLVFMDFAGTDTFKGTAVNGKRLLDAIINCNSKLPTAITNPIVDVNNGNRYTIDGMPASRNSKGIIIVNGRKFVTRQH